MPLLVLFRAQLPFVRNIRPISFLTTCFNQDCDLSYIQSPEEASNGVVVVDVVDDDDVAAAEDVADAIVENEIDVAGAVHFVRPAPFALIDTIVNLQSHVVDNPFPKSGGFVGSMTIVQAASIILRTEASTQWRRE